MRGIFEFLGLEGEHVSNAEKLVSIIGAALGIYFVSLISYYSTDAQGVAYIVPSMGAAAVLLFAVPHGRLSQPWALFGGNAISALVGVTCYKVIPDSFLAAALAVGLAIGAMHLTNCIHPPGGATALAAVIGGPAVHELGYSFIFLPIFINTLILFSMAMLFNSVFPWRRYPVSMMRYKNVSAQTSHSISKQAIEKAIEEMDVIMDITIEELQSLIDISIKHERNLDINPERIKVGRYYASGRPGAEWSIRKVVDHRESSNPEHDMVIYEIVEGSGERLTNSCTRIQFAEWAAFEVQPKKQPGK